MHTKLKKVYEQMDEWERKRKGRTYRMICPEERGRTTEDTDKRKETRTSVQEWTAGNVITSMGNSQKGATKEKERLGRSAFVGGIAPGTSSGMLQSHMQRFAQVKYCALLVGDRK